MEFNEKARYELINFLIKKYNFTDYLEIGYQQGINYNKINIKNKTAVDPSPLMNISSNDVDIINGVYVEKKNNLYLIPSDLFFQKFTYKYDIIFIDGLHTYEQVKNDFENSIKSLNPNGVIVLHDMNPDDVNVNGHIISGEERAKSFNEGGQWNGDCFKLAIDIYNGLYNYKYVTLDMDNGCMAVFPFISREIYENKNITKDYKSLENDRVNILNLKTPIDFLESVVL
jgi:hypothetical protein